MTTDEIENLSTKARQCFEHLEMHPGDQPQADRLLRILRQLAQASPRLRLIKLVSIYKLACAPKLDVQLERYRQPELDSLKTDLQFGNLYRYEDEKDGKKKIYPHQRRLGADILKQTSYKLSKRTNLKNIAQCQSFCELLQRIESATRPLDGFGQMALYDTALRIGAKLDRWPKVANRGPWRATRTFVPCVWAMQIL